MGTIISQDELVATYQEAGEVIPPQFVLAPYFEIDGKGYYFINVDPIPLVETLVEIRCRLVEGDRGQGLIDVIDKALGLKGDDDNAG
jgi:hypothetical protein